MYKKIFEPRRKLPIINGLLAIMMMLGTFSAAYAQEGNTQVLLPLFQAGTSSTQPADGPFLDVPDSFDGEEFLDNSSEAQAAGSCYGSGFNVDTRKISGNVYVTDRIHVRSYRGSSCNDLNIYADSLDPHTGCMKYEVHIYDRYNNWKRWTGVNWVCRSQQWKVLATNLDYQDSYRITFYQNPGSNVRLAD